MINLLSEESKGAVQTLRFSFLVPLPATLRYPLEMNESPSSGPLTGRWRLGAWLTLTFGLWPLEDELVRVDVENKRQKRTDNKRKRDSAKKAESQSRPYVDNTDTVGRNFKTPKRS